jgi:hypothetical protein
MQARHIQRSRGACTNTQLATPIQLNNVEERRKPFKTNRLFKTNRWRGTRIAIMQAIRGNDGDKALPFLPIELQFIIGSYLPVKDAISAAATSKGNPLITIRRDELVLGCSKDADDGPDALHKLFNGPDATVWTFIKRHSYVTNVVVRVCVNSAEMLPMLNEIATTHSDALEEAAVLLDIDLSSWDNMGLATAAILSALLDLARCCATRVSSLVLSVYRVYPSAGFAAIAKFSNLRKLNLDKTRHMSVAQAHMLAKLTNLEHLAMRLIRMEEAVILELCQLPNLAHITVDFAADDVESVRHLGRLPKLQSVEHLGLRRRQRGSDLTTICNSFRHLAAIQGLRSLAICGGRPNVNGFANISQLTNLRSLRVHCTRFSKEICQHLAKLTNLEELVFEGGSDFDDVAGMHLLGSLTCSICWI